MPHTVVRSRIDPDTKKDADRIFKRLGLTMSDAIRLFLRQSVERNGLPFEVKLPSEETKAAIEELEKGGGESITLERMRREWNDACAK